MTELLVGNQLAALSLDASLSPAIEHSARRFPSATLVPSTLPYTPFVPPTRPLSHASNDHNSNLNKMNRFYSSLERTNSLDSRGSEESANSWHGANGNAYGYGMASSGMGFPQQQHGMGMGYGGMQYGYPQAQHAYPTTSYAARPSPASFYPSPPSPYAPSYASLRPALPEEVIPTAIVIKNIPFTVPKEMLLSVMEELRLPPPVAFNYHFDNAQFRGLAFANFRSPAEAALTVSALNGFDLQGRKLRTEFKKVLKEGEKERIERDKALKRMRSQRELAAVAPPPLPTMIEPWNRRDASFSPVAQLEEEDYGQVLQGGGSFSESFRAVPPPLAHTHSNGSGSSFGGARTATREYVPAPAPASNAFGGSLWGGEMPVVPPHESGSTSSNDGTELDLNDPLSLEIFSRVLIFKDDSLRDELAFSRNLSAGQRRIVGLVAKKLGLKSCSVGVGGERFVSVFKGDGGRERDGMRTLRHSASAVSRGSTSSLTQNAPHASNVAFLTPSIYCTSQGLRGKKSMPEIRHTTYRSSLDQSPTSGLEWESRELNGASASSWGSMGRGVRKSNVNLREGFNTLPGGMRRKKNASMMGLFQQGGFYESSADSNADQFDPSPSFAPHGGKKSVGGSSTESGDTGSTSATTAGSAGDIWGDGGGVAFRQSKGPEDVGDFGRI